MKVLIVDDDKLARKGLIAIMNWEKYRWKIMVFRIRMQRI